MFDTCTSNALRAVHWHHGYGGSSSSDDSAKKEIDVSKVLHEHRASQRQEMARVSEQQRKSSVQLILGGLRPHAATQSESASRYNPHLQVAGAQMVGKSHREVAQESLASRPNRYHQIYGRGGVDWQTEQSMFDCKTVQDKALPCRPALQSNIPLGIGATCQAGAPAEPAETKADTVLQKAASESAMHRASMAERETNKGANQGHIDLSNGRSIGRLRSQSQWRTSQSMASEANVAAKWNCLKPDNCKSLQGVRDESGAIRMSNMYFGNNPDDLALERESCRYGERLAQSKHTRSPARTRTSESVLPAFAGERAPHSHQWTPAGGAFLRR